ncbi:hypothetical protein A2797_02805 [candidate division WWE3 bacterium RIFCSPHIGHO2_01_FULL_48_15]|uniref:FAD/NAD(P)-binding domain-containing protein n=1 Tax=candidate division WWE3 bacterium RIFCSPHIGHO2_01_FULL_48_15 TaxID=1802619 RepID=A0A1F4VC66_UNCKA|nr:MAG: hypothetical protein A2797_02805 [candidate division WWE3 bacterium RIFCSPHIGHO2_01_FULL_48_15]
MSVKNIVILGGGFGGLRTALTLECAIGKDPGYKIILIDQNTFQLYTASLYEVAVGELTHRGILLPFNQLLKGKKVEFINSRVTGIDPKRKVIRTVAGDNIPYEKVVFALGSDTEDFGIPGVAEHTIGLKSVTDAEKIRDKINRCSVLKKEPIRMVVGGGGFAGVELAGELAGYSFCPLDITIVEGTPRLLSGLPEKISSAVAKRLNFLGVKVQTSSFIARVEPKEVILKSGRKLPFDVAIWTSGVRGSRFVDPQLFPLDKKKALVVDGYLRVKGYEDIFAIGDLAGTGVPWTAVKAEADGKLVAKNILAQLKDKPMQKREAFGIPFIVPVGKKWAVAKIGPFVFWGLLAAVLKNLVLLYYLAQIVDPLTAIKIWWKGESELLGRTHETKHL